MIPFHAPTPEDRLWAEPLLSRYGDAGSEAAFGTYYLWQDRYHFRIAHHRGFFVAWCGGGYFFPIGAGDMRPVLRDIEKDAAQRGVPFRFLLSEHWCEELDRAFPGKFRFREIRSNADYIYRVEDLANLSGKKYHGKRNHISKFTRLYDHTFEHVTTEAQVKECMEMARKWAALSDNPADAEAELEAIEKSFRDRDKLGMIAGLIRVDGEVIAFGAGEPINTKVFDQHFEKALVSYDGAYAVINHEFMVNCLSSYEFVNREEDMGIEGLRKAKQSYLPARLLRKYTAECPEV